MNTPAVNAAQLKGTIIMAKTTKKTAKKTATKVETNSAKAKTALRKGTLAYLGLYGFAYERAVKRAEQVKGLYTSATDGLFQDLVARGENVETLVVSTAKTTQKRAVETFETTTDKVKSALPTTLPFGANDRVEELEAEVKALNKKISALSKKASAPRKATIKTEKTVKKAA